MFHFDLEHEAVCLKLVYDAERYDRDYMIQAAEHLDQLLAIMLNRPDLELSQVEMLSASQRNKLLFDFNDTRVEYPQHKAMHQLFEEQVERTPDHPAVIFENRSLTYRELNQQSNRLARTLQDKGVQTGQFVGIMAERSLEMIVGLFGILKAGELMFPSIRNILQIVFSISLRIRMRPGCCITVIYRSLENMQGRLSFSMLRPIAITVI